MYIGEIKLFTQNDQELETLIQGSENIQLGHRDVFYKEKCVIQLMRSGTRKIK